MQFIMSNEAKKNVLRACMFRIGWSTHAQFIPKICWHLCAAHKPKIFRRRERVRFSAVIAFGKTKSCLISMKIRMLQDPANVTQDLDLSQQRACFVAVITINQTGRVIFTLSKKILNSRVYEKLELSSLNGFNIEIHCTV